MIVYVNNTLSFNKICCFTYKTVLYTYANTENCTTSFKTGDRLCTYAYYEA